MWTLNLWVEILEIFAEEQRKVDQYSGELSRWAWAREKRREYARTTEARPERRAAKYAYLKGARTEAIRQRLRAGERPKRWGRQWAAIAAELGIVQ